MVLPVPTLRGDLTGTAFGAAPTWTDYTGFLELGADGSPIDLTWGRQDNRADVPAGIFSFTLNNTDGRFTTGASIIETDHVFNVRLTANGITTDRITGVVTSVEPTWPGGVQSWSIVRVTCVDYTGPLSAGQTLLSMIEQEMLADGAVALYPLSETTGSVSAGDVSGHGAESLKPTAGKYGPGILTFGAAGVSGEVPSVQFAPGSNDMEAATVLQNSGSMIPLTPPLTIEFWFVIDALINAGSGAPSYTNPLLTAGDSSGYLIKMGVGDPNNFNPGCLLVTLYNRGQGTGATAFFGLGSPGRVDDQKWHHAVVTVAAGGLSGTLYIDGVAGTPVTSPAALVFPSLKVLQVGGYLVGAPIPFSPVVASNARVGLVAFYQTALTAAQVLAHYQIGAGTLTERSDQRFARIARYGKLTTSGLPVGAAVMGPQLTSGRTALDVETEVARTEGSVCYPTGAGAFTFQGRAARYNVAVALALTGEDIAPDLPIRKDKQDFFNELTVERAGGATQRYVNTASQSGRSGRIDGGSFTVAPSTDADAYQNAAWQVGVHSPTTSRVRFPSLTLDLLSRDAVTQASILALGISSLVTLSSLPSQAPAAAASLFIEGGHEVIGVDEFRIDFYTSQQTIEGQVWTLDDASSKGALDGTAVLAF